MKSIKFATLALITFQVIICISCKKSNQFSNKEEITQDLSERTASTTNSMQSKSNTSKNNLLGLWEGVYEGDSDLQTKNEKLKKIQKDLLNDLSQEFQIAFKENNEFEIIMFGQLDNGIYTLENDLIKLKSIHGDLEIHQEGDKLWWDLPHSDKMVLHKISEDYTKIRKGKSDGAFAGMLDGMPFGIYTTWEFVDLLPESGSAHDGIELMKSLEMASTLTFDDNKSFTKKRNNTLIKGTFRTDSENIYINMESGKSEKYKVVGLTLNELKLKDSELNAIRIYKRVE